MLLVEHWLNISPAYITPVLDAACYLLAYKYLGGNFIKISIISTLFISGFYKIWEQFPPMLPDLSAYPLLAAIAGGILSASAWAHHPGRAVPAAAMTPWPDNLPRHRPAPIAGVSLYGYCCAGIIPHVYPCFAHYFSLITVTISSYLIDWVKGYKPKRMLTKSAV